MSDAYRVEQDDPGCGACGHDATWWVVGPDETASSSSYGDQEEAESLARALNAAYELGQATQLLGATDWVLFSEPPKDHTHVLVWDAEFKSVGVLYYVAESDTPEVLKQRQYTHWRLPMAGPTSPVTPETPATEGPMPAINLKATPAHQYGEGGEWAWSQSCNCVRCAAETARIARQQAAAAPGDIDWDAIPF